jgi:hypothetical protein
LNSLEDNEHDDWYAIIVNDDNLIITLPVDYFNIFSIDIDYYPVANDLNFSFYDPHNE